MAMMRFDPLRELESMREAMEEAFWPLAVPPRLLEFETTVLFPVNMWETDKDLVIRAAVPGFKPEDIHISVSDNLLSVRGEHKEEEKVKREDYYRHELLAGSFHREISLPVPVNADKAEATFENGILTLRLPKTEQAKARKIAIKGQEQQARKKIQAKPQEPRH